MIRFVATRVVVEATDGETLVGCANDLGAGFHLQRSDRRALDGGHANCRFWAYYDKEGQQWSSNTCPRRVVLKRDQFRAEFSAGVATELSDNEFSIRLEISELDFEQLEAGIRLVLAGTRVLTVEPP